MLRRRVTAAFFTIVMASACSSPENAQPRGGTPPPQSARSLPAHDAEFVIAPDLPTLPALAVANSGQSPELVRAVHTFAARHPEVLNYMPCFCGCQRAGHSDNHDCFVAGRDSAGKVTSWEVHGVGCQICVAVARDAMQMYNSGAKVAAIRKAIDTKYADHPTRTPTPIPPTGKG